MGGNPKRLEAHFYSNAAGIEPVRDWLRELTRDDRLAIGTDIKTVEFGWPIGMPTCRPMGKGLFEVRTKLKDRIARVLFCIHDGDMVLLHGFIKKSQKTPQGDLELALTRKREVERQRWARKTSESVRHWTTCSQRTGPMARPPPQPSSG